ncbi:hypothetical protein KC19_VG065700 [Ceratodon purpureus]|uniref:Pre-mRNA processing factor 4 (PRP4)-like domain-containing protein n=1 Tax=Ceratodon purpureus TaxID=3225 RepID=A0A8T0HN09_CERPU|nr:hypothetical protein KC19_VG065700 [Ceratodon purpureus]
MADLFLPPGVPAAAHGDVDMDPLPDPPHPAHLNAAQDPSSSSEDEDDDAPDSSADSGDHPMVDGDDADRYLASEESQCARDRKEQLVQQLLMKRRAAALAVPTNDSAVRQRLRHLGHPITLFGEREMERRDRLRVILAKLDADGDLDKLVQAHEASADTRGEEAYQESVPDDVQPLQLFYTEGSSELLECRQGILKYSLPRAKARFERAKRMRTERDEDEDAETDEMLRSMAETTLDCSEIGDGRPLSSCAFSPDASMLVTGSWTGVAKLWSVPDVKLLGTFKGHHTERVTDVVFHPAACKTLGVEAENVATVATASADRTTVLWSRKGKKLQSYEGHLDRLARIAFHPSGAYIGTASFDKTWRLWDVNTGIELLLQEGHSRSVYGLAFQQDGALAASCGMDALARVWDLRTGKSVLALEGHVKSVYGVDFSPNGYHLATGSDDHTCRVWDLRKKQCLYIIPAHNSLISQVKYEPSEGYFLVTASFDNTVRIWSILDFKPVKTLVGHESKVAGVDVSADGSYIATVSHDRTIKLWSHYNS